MKKEKFDLKEQLKNLPDLSGVYLMHDKTDTVIYVGKAKILKNRVRQYFQKNSNHAPKVISMVSNIAWFEYIVTDSEIEALALECNLIKKYKPRYNVLLRDDKHFPYIKITMNQDWPRIVVTRQFIRDGSKYFGPYMGMSMIYPLLEIIKQVFRIPSCNRKFPNDIGKGRPCLNYHIGRCFAPCTGVATNEEYRQIFNDICKFLAGHHEEFIDEMTQEMEKLAERLEFEKAAELRNKIDAVRSMSEKQKAISTTREEQDIVAFECYDDIAFIEIFFVRNGKVNGRQTLKIKSITGMTNQEIMGEFVKQFYDGAIFIPKEVILQHDIEDICSIEEWLSEKRGNKVTVTIPIKGEKANLISMVARNASISVGDHKIELLKRKDENKTLDMLTKLLGLEKSPKRIESYDISNISGTNSVASMIVFVNGKPLKREYKKFKIKFVEGMDDYHSMQEVILRRFTHAARTGSDAFAEMPDLLLIDGGKTHVKAVIEALDSIDMKFPVFGMVKDNKHRTRGLVNDIGELDIPINGNVFRLIAQVQDEVHNYAINYHQQLRSRQMTQSQLENIKGVGEAKRTALIKHFKTINKVKIASFDELMDVPRMDKSTAQNIIDYFSSEKNAES